MTITKSPAFQFYPKDFLSDEEQAAMSLAECGLYIRLLCRAWDNGSIPNDLERLAKLVGATLADLRRYWPAVSVKFVPHVTEPGRLVNPRLERERVKQAEFKDRQAGNGRKGGRPQKPKEPKPFENETHDIESGISKTKPKKSSASASASADCGLSAHLERAPIARATEPETHNNPSLSVSERAGRFCERYAQLHAQYRNGAKLVKTPAFRSPLGAGNLEFQEAVTLCETWDDARLETLAHAFLTTDDEWVDSGPRTIARFRSRASWCDDRLREAGL